jgi:hypothetical protein
MNMQNMSEDGTKMFQSTKIRTMTAELLNSLGLVMEKQLIKRKNKRRKGRLVAT